jgi:catalase
MMQTQVPVGRANYEPNSLSDAGEEGGPRECPTTGFTTLALNNERNDGTEKMRVRPELFADHFSQARMFYQSQTPIEQAHIASAIVFELSKVNLEHVRSRILGLLRNVDESLSQRVSDGLGMELPPKAKAARALVDMPVSDALSIMKNAKPTLKGRKYGIFFAEGSSKEAIDTLKGEIEAEGGTVFLVAPKVGGIPVNGGTLKADGQLAGSPSVLFDGIASIIMPDQAEILAKNGAAVQWFMDAFSHCKPIGYCPATQLILEKGHVNYDEAVVPNADFVGIAGQRYWDREPSVRDLA